MLTEDKYKRLISYLFIICLIILNIFILNQLFKYPFFYNIKKALFNIFIPFLISFIIVYIFHPLLYWIEKHFSIKTWITNLVLLFLNGLIIIILINFFIPLINKQLIDIIGNLPRYGNELTNTLNNLKEKYTFLDNEIVNNALNKVNKSFTTVIGDSFIESIINLLIILLKSMWLMIIIPILVFIMMKDYPLFYDKLSKFLIKHQKRDWMILLKNIDKKLGLYIRGQLFIVLYMFIGTFIPLLILGMPNAFLFSLLIAFTNLIPYIGPYIGGIPLCIYAYYESQNLLIASLIIIFVMQQFDGNIGQPIVYGSQLHLHPLVIMTVMIIGSSFGGIIGLVLSIPIYILISEVYIFFKAKLKKQLS